MADRTQDPIQTRQLQCRADTINSDARTVEAVIATEDPVRMYDWRNHRDIDEVLAMKHMVMPEGSQMVMLDSHDRWTTDTVIGSIRDLRIEGGNLTGTLHFVKGDDDVDRIWNKVEQGHLRDISVGYRVSKFQDIEPDTTVTIEGTKYTAGSTAMRVATEWRPHEGSVVAVGADRRSKIREADESQLSSREGASTVKPAKSGSDPNEERTMSDATDAAETPKQEVDAQRTAPVSASPEIIDTEAIRREAISEGVRLESERRTAITALAQDDVTAECLQRALDDPECTVEAAQNMFLQDIRSQRTSRPPATDAPNIQLSGRRERDCTVETLGAAVAMRMHHGNDIENTYSRVMHMQSGRLVLMERPSSRQAEMDNILERADEFRRMALFDICREALRIDGVDAPVDPEEMIQRAMSTPALSSIFSNAVGAELLANFEEHPDTTRGWCRESDTSNFHPLERHRLDGGRLTKHRRGREADHGDASDRKETIRAHRYSKQMTIDEMDIADDTLNALQDGAMDIGLATGTLRPDLVYAVLLSNPTLSDTIALFHASHGNLDATGSLGTMCNLLAKQKNSQDINIGLPARFVITSTDKADDAYRLISSRETRGTGETLGVNNPVQRRNLEAREEPRLSTGFIDPDTGATVAAAANTYFVMSNQVAYNLEVIYGLTGRMPSVRSSILTQGKFGINWDVKYDIGVAPLDHRGMAQSTAAIVQ